MKRFIDNIEEYIAVILMALLIFLCFIQVIFRFLLNMPLGWTEELANFTFITLVYIGACIAVKRSRHVRVEIIDSFIPKKYENVYKNIVDFICMVFVAIVAYNAIPFIARAMEYHERTAALRWKIWMVYSIIPVTMGIMCIRYMQNIYHRCKNKKGEDKA